MSHIINMITVCEGRFKERREKKRRGKEWQDKTIIHTHAHTKKTEVRTFFFIKEIAIQVHE